MESGRVSNSEQSQSDKNAPTPRTDEVWKDSTKEWGTVEHDRYRTSKDLERELAEESKAHSATCDECAALEAKLAERSAEVAPDIPLCAGHADWWFTSRNHLKGDHGCVVCAFQPSIEEAARSHEGTRYRMTAKFDDETRVIEGTLYELPSEITPAMVDAVNALPEWGGFTADDLKLLVSTLRFAASATGTHE